MRTEDMKVHDGLKDRTKKAQTKNFPLETQIFGNRPRPFLGPTQPPVQWVLGLFSGGKAAAA